MAENKLTLTSYYKKAVENVIDTNITEFANDSKATTIKDISDFFNYYDKIKGEISQLNVSESHQYLINEAIKETDGNIYI